MILADRHGVEDTRLADAFPGADTLRARGFDRICVAFEGVPEAQPMTAAEVRRYLRARLPLDVATRARLARTHPETAALLDEAGGIEACPLQERMLDRLEALGATGFTIDLRGLERLTSRKPSPANGFGLTEPEAGL